MSELAFSTTYALGKRIAVGTRGVLYECIHKTTGKQFVCKVVRGQDNIRVNHCEEKMTRACNHNNIVKVHQVYFDYANQFNPRKMIIYDRADDVWALVEETILQSPLLGRFVFSIVL